MGEALKQVSQAKDSMDIRVKQTFIDPLQSIQDNELKEIRVSLAYNVIKMAKCYSFANEHGFTAFFLFVSTI